MPLRRRAWFSREGLYYSGVLGFIVGGAVLRSINLLVVLAGMMIAPLLLNWRLVMASLRGLIVIRRLPEQVCAGEELTVEVTVENTRRFLGSLLLVLEDWIEREDDGEQGTADRGLGTGDSQGAASSTRGGNAVWRRLANVFGARSTRTETLVPYVAPRSTTTATYRVALPRRGRYRFGPLRVSTRYPLGLVWGHFTLPAEGELIVAPRLGRLSPQWANLLESELAGEQRRHPQRGVAEGDYYGLRPWQSGDSTRWIHWRTTAKLGTPTVMQFERQRNHEVALVLDPYVSGPGERDQGLLELAVSLAATAVADLTSRGHARLTVAVAAHPPQVWTGPASPLFCQEILAYLAVLQGAGGHPFAATLNRVRDETPSGVRLIVISPRSPLSAGVEPDERLTWIDVSESGLAGLFTLP